MSTQLDDRQMVNRAALSALGNSANLTLDVIMSDINTYFANATSLATASVLMERDSHANVQANNYIDNLTSTATAAGTTTLTVSSSFFQQFTGSTTQTVVLPNATTLVVGQSFCITNRSTGNVTIETNGAATLQVLTANSQALVAVTNIGTSAGTWDVAYTVTGPVQYLQTQVTTDATTTGSAATLLTADTSYGTVRLTNGSLVSVSGIVAGASGQYMTIENQTGNLILINNNDSGASAANRIFTGTGANVTMSSNASFSFVYDTTVSMWMLVGGTGSGSGSGSGKNYLSVVTTSQSTNPNTGNGNFEFGSTAGWDWCNVGTLTNGIPTGTPNFTSVSTNALYAFTISTSTTCAVGDTYTNVNSGTQTFTVVTALSAQSGTVFFATGTGDPTASGTLTRATGSGTSSITFSAFTKETMSVVSSGQLAGSYSQSVATSGVTTAGLGFCSNAFYIDTEDQAKVLTWKFYYTAHSGATNDNFSGTSSNSFGVAIYDVTNSAWIPTTSAFGMTQSSGVGYATGTFQTGLTTAQLRFVIYNVNATSGATTLYFDDFTVGPQTAPFGPVMTDWVQYTPTFVGFGTVSTSNVYSRRVGADLEVYGSFVSGTPTAVAASMTLGFNGANSNVTTTSVVNYTAGYFQSNYSTESVQGGIYNSGGTTTVNFAVVSPSVTTGLTVTNGNTIAISSTTIAFSFRAPIVGWSSNVQMSSDTDTRVVAFQANEQTPTGTIANANNVVKFGTVTNDTHSGYNTSTGLYTVPVTGYYKMLATLEITGTYTSGEFNQAIFLKNGSTDIAIGTWVAQASLTGKAGPTTVSGGCLCNAGDTIGLYSNSNGTSLSFTATVQGSSLYISRESGPSVIAATESVNMRYTDTSGGSITATPAVYKFTTQTYDSHNAYSTSTGLYTVPVSGKYSVKVVMQVASVSLSTSQVFELLLYKNSSFYSNLGVVFGNGTSQPWITGGSDDVACVAGDTLEIYAASTTSTTGGTSAGVNHFSITRAGN